MKPLTDQEFEMTASKFRSTYGNIFGCGLDLGAIGRLFAEVDFCNQCTDEMSQTHQEKIAALRHIRWMEKRVDPFVIRDAIALKRPAS